MNNKYSNFELVKAIKKTNNEIIKQEQKIVRKYGLTSSQYGTLECLYMKGDMCINELIKRQISTSGTMTVIIKNLEKKGYITKKSNCNDKRFFKVCLTDSGKSIIGKIKPERELQLEDFSNTLSSNEKENLINLLYKFKEKYKEK